MARKAYSDEERAKVKEALMTTMIQCIADRGLIHSSIDVLDVYKRQGLLLQVYVHIGTFSLVRWRQTDAAQQKLRRTDSPSTAI